MKSTTSQSNSGALVELGEWLTPDAIRGAAPEALLERVRAEPQRAFPAIAKDSGACSRLNDAVTALTTDIASTTATAGA